MNRHPFFPTGPTSHSVPALAPRSPRLAANADALVVLRRFHDVVLELFVDFEHLPSAADQGPLRRDQKSRLAAKLLRELNLLIQIEDEVFYPAVRAAVANDALMNVLEVEHQGAMHIIMELDTLEPDDEMYDAHLDVLGKNVRRHIEQERAVLFGMVRHSSLNTEALAQKMISLRSALLFNDDAIPHAERLPPQ
jgi:hemerythrin-like domain-containing protein